MLKQESTEKQVPFYEDYLPLKLLVTAFWVPFRTFLSLNVFTFFNLLLPRQCSCKESTNQCRRHKRCQLDPWVEKIPWSRKWQPTLVFLHGKSHRQRSLAGYSSWGSQRARHDGATEHTHTQMYLFLLFFAINKNTEYSLFHYDLFFYFLI